MNIIYLFGWSGLQFRTQAYWSYGLGSFGIVYHTISTNRLRVVNFRTIGTLETKCFFSVSPFSSSNLISLIFQIVKQQCTPFSLRRPWPTNKYQVGKWPAVDGLEPATFTSKRYDFTCLRAVGRWMQICTGFTISQQNPSFLLAITFESRLLLISNRREATGWS